MKGEDLFRGLNYINAVFVEEAETVTQLAGDRKHLSLRRTVLIAATVAIGNRESLPSHSVIKGLNNVNRHTADIPYSHAPASWIAPKTCLLRSTSFRAPKTPTPAATLSISSLYTLLRA